MARNYYELKTSYNYNELSDSAKERAKEWLNQGGYSWGDDAMNTLRALTAHFDGKLSDWSIDWANPSASSVSFSMPEMSHAEFARRLSELGEFNPETGKGLGDCKLTGVCFDEDAIDGLRAAFASLPVPDESAQYDEDGEEDEDWGLINSEDIEELMQSAWWQLALSCRDDYESQFSDEYVIETCEANGYVFFANGEPA